MDKISPMPIRPNGNAIISVSNACWLLNPADAAVLFTTYNGACLSMGELTTNCQSHFVCTDVAMRHFFKENRLKRQRHVDPATTAVQLISRTAEQAPLLRIAEPHIGTGKPIVKGHWLLAGVEPSLIKPGSLAAAPIQEAPGTDALELS